MNRTLENGNMQVNDLNIKKMSKPKKVPLICYQISYFRNSLNSSIVRAVSRKILFKVLGWRILPE